MRPTPACGGVTSSSGAGWGRWALYPCMRKHNTAKQTTWRGRRALPRHTWTQLLDVCDKGKRIRSNPACGGTTPLLRARKRERTALTLRAGVQRDGPLGVHGVPRSNPACGGTTPTSRTAESGNYKGLGAGTPRVRVSRFSGSFARSLGSALGTEQAQKREEGSQPPCATKYTGASCFSSSFARPLRSALGIEQTRKKWRGVSCFSNSFARSLGSALGTEQARNIGAQAVD